MKINAMDKAAKGIVMGLSQSPNCLGALDPSENL